jgi:hypothetical protein
VADEAKDPSLRKLPVRRQGDRYVAKNGAAWAPGLARRAIWCASIRGRTHGNGFAVHLGHLCGSIIQVGSAALLR